MGLLDCVASPEERDKFDERERPYTRPPRELSRSDHDISRRRALPLFSSQASLKNIRDVDFWRTRVLRFLYSPEGREDIRVLKVPFKQLGYSSVTDFIAEIPAENFSEFLNQIPPDEGIFKDDKVFWVHDGIAEPGIFKWQGPLEDVPIIGLQLDRKKAVPFRLNDGKGLFYCKPGHRALVPEHEVTPYKKFLRSFIGLPPRLDSLVGMRDSVRCSEKAIAAKNSKPGDRVYLPKEKQWATVQWIGKIDGETVVDLVYEPPKPEAGKPVSPDEPGISRSISLADFIDELASEPNTPLPTQQQEQQQRAPPTTETLIVQSPKPAPPPPPPEPPTSPLPDESSDESMHSDHDQAQSTDEEDDDDSESEDDDSASETDQSMDGTDQESDYEDEHHKPDASLSMGNVQLQNMDEDKIQEIPEIVEELSPTIPSPKRKGFFGFTQNKKQKSPKSPTALNVEQKGEFKSLPELMHSPTTPRARNSNIFGSLRFRKGNKQKKEPPPEKMPEKAKSTTEVSPKKKSGLSSSWGALFKSKSKTQLQKLVIDDTTSPLECTTPIDDMIPPDKIPTPPPSEGYNERRIDRPEFMDMPVPYTGQLNDDNEKERGEVSLDPEDQTSESDTSDTDEDEGQGETQNVTVHMHVPTPVTPAPRTGGTKLGEIKITTLEKEVVQGDGVENRNKQSVDSTDREQVSPENDDNSTPPNSLGQFKESKVRNRPTSLASFLARIKNRKPGSSDGPTNPPVPMSPPSIPNDREGNIEQEDDDAAKMPTQTDDRKNSIQSVSSHTSSEHTDGNDSNNGSSGAVIGINMSLVKPKVGVQPVVDNDSSGAVIGINRSLVKPQAGVQPVVDNESKGAVIGINRSLVKPQADVQSMSINENEGNQDGIVLELLDVKEQTAPVNTPPPIPTTDPPKRTPSRKKSFTFSFSGKRKPSHSQPPPTPLPKEEQPQPPQNSDNEVSNNENRENIDPAVEEPPTKIEDEEKERKQSKPSSFRNSFKRTFSLTRNKKRPSIDTEQGSSAPNSPSTPTNRISKPRPVTLFIDNNEAIQTRDSFRNKRPASLVVDIKPWSMRHGRNNVDIYSSPSSDEAPTSPTKSPNPALLPKQTDANVPKHRMFTTPAFFYKRPSKKSDNEPLIPKTSKETSDKKSKEQDSNNQPETPNSPEASPISEQPPPVPAGPPPDTPSHPAQGSGAKLKSALKQRKEIESIPKGLKINDRVLWYSGRGPVPGTVLRLFKDGTDKYTAMVKFDREVPEEPLRITREGDAYIVTVEELITPDMFEPTYANQSEIDRISSAAEPVTPITPSVRFDGLMEEDPVPEVIVTGEDTPPEVEEHDLPPPFQEEEVTMACGYRRGVQSRDKSCCLETILFSMFYTTNAFDITMLYANSSNEDSLTRKVRNILRKEIVDPLRREGFCPSNAVNKLRDAVKPLSDEWQTFSTDAEVMMFILFDRALKLQKFISYSNDISDFLHQLVVDPKDLSKSTTIQHLFETSLQMMDNLKLKTVPTPALILEMPRSNDQLMQYKAVVPNLSLTVSHILDGGPRLCICGAVAKYSCQTCTTNVGPMSIVYCDNCKSTADVIHFQLTHDVQLAPLNQPVIILDLSAIICVKGGHYFSFVKCGQNQLSPWVFFDGADLENPKVCIEQNLSMWLDRLERYPGRYQDALQYPLLTHILQDSHICIYEPREKSSSV